MMGYGAGPGAMGYGVMDEDMYEEMAEHMAGDDFAEIYEEMEEGMEEHTGYGWRGMHEYCERVMGIEEDE